MVATRSAGKPLADPTALEKPKVKAKTTRPSPSAAQKKQKQQETPARKQSAPVKRQPALVEKQPFPAMRRQAPSTSRQTAGEPGPEPEAEVTKQPPTSKKASSQWTPAYLLTQAGRRELYAAADPTGVLLASGAYGVSTLDSCAERLLDEGCRRILPSRFVNNFVSILDVLHNRIVIPYAYCTGQRGLLKSHSLLRSELSDTIFANEPVGLLKLVQEQPAFRRDLDFLFPDWQQRFQHPSDRTLRWDWQTEAPSTPSDLEELAMRLNSDNIKDWLENREICLQRERHPEKIDLWRVSTRNLDQPEWDKPRKWAWTKYDMAMLADIGVKVLRFISSQTLEELHQLTPEDLELVQWVLEGLETDDDPDGVLRSVNDPPDAARGAETNTSGVFRPSNPIALGGWAGMNTGGSVRPSNPLDPNGWVGTYSDDFHRPSSPVLTSGRTGANIRGFLQPSSSVVPSGWAGTYSDDFHRPSSPVLTSGRAETNNNVHFHLTSPAWVPQRASTRGQPSQDPQAAYTLMEDDSDSNEEPEEVDAQEVRDLADRPAKRKSLSKSGNQLDKTYVPRDDDDEDSEPETSKEARDRQLQDERFERIKEHVNTLRRQAARATPEISEKPRDLPGQRTKSNAHLPSYRRPTIESISDAGEPRPSYIDLQVEKFKRAKKLQKENQQSLGVRSVKERTFPNFAYAYPFPRVTDSEFYNLTLACHQLMHTLLGSGWTSPGFSRDDMHDWIAEGHSQNMTPEELEQKCPEDVISSGADDRELILRPLGAHEFQLLKDLLPQKPVIAPDERDDGLLTEFIQYRIRALLKGRPQTEEWMWNEERMTTEGLCNAVNRVEYTASGFPRQTASITPQRLYPVARRLATAGELTWEPSAGHPKGLFSRPKQVQPRRMLWWSLQELSAYERRICGLKLNEADTADFDSVYREPPAWVPLSAARDSEEFDGQVRLMTDLYHRLGFRFGWTLRTLETYVSNCTFTGINPLQRISRPLGKYKRTLITQELDDIERSMADGAGSDLDRDDRAKAYLTLFSNRDSDALDSIWSLETRLKWKREQMSYAGLELRARERARLVQLPVLDSPLGNERILKELPGLEQHVKRLEQKRHRRKYVEDEVLAEYVSEMRAKRKEEETPRQSQSKEGTPLDLPRWMLESPTGWESVQEPVQVWSVPSITTKVSTGGRAPLPKASEAAETGPIRSCAPIKTVAFATNTSSPPGIKPTYISSYPGHSRASQAVASGSGTARSQLTAEESAGDESDEVEDKSIFFADEQYEGKFFHPGVTEWWGDDGPGGVRAREEAMQAESNGKIKGLYGTFPRLSSTVKAMGSLDPPGQIRKSLAVKESVKGKETASDKVPSIGLAATQWQEAGRRSRRSAGQNDSERKRSKAKEGKGASKPSAEPTPRSVAAPAPQDEEEDEEDEKEDEETAERHVEAQKPQQESMFAGMKRKFGIGAVSESRKRHKSTPLESRTMELRAVDDDDSN